MYMKMKTERSNIRQHGKSKGPMNLKYSVCHLHEHEGEIHYDKTTVGGNQDVNVLAREPNN